MIPPHTGYMEQNVMERPASTGSDYHRIRRALERLAARFPEQPSLGDLAAEAGLSEHHFQRMFTAWAGVSPKKFLQHLTLEAAKRRLDESASLLDAAFDAGLSGPGRLHDLFVSLEAMTPGEYKARGEGVTICYGYHGSPFGECLLMSTDRGICGLAFTEPEGRQAALDHLTRGWERAEISRADAVTEPMANRIFQKPGEGAAGMPPLRLLVRGSRFQLAVWRGLLSVPPGALTTYAELARHIGLPPGAARAVGTANGANAIAWLIPCHRVIRKTGAMGGYRWGEARKLAMIGWEASAEG
jgi:AraC family transcriptional regulator of adaptative response/methylated-DNA-[protein]-cysteine methyltransferase